MNIFVSRLMPPDLLRPLTGAGHTVDVYDKDEACPRDVLVVRSRSADALIVHGLDVVDAELLAVASRLKVVATCSIGHDNIDTECARSRAIVVCNSPTTELVAATAEAAVGLLLDVAKRLTRLHTEQQRGVFSPYSVFEPMGRPVSGAVTGIIGLGQIGSAVARIMKDGFNNSVLYVGRRSKPDLEKLLGAQRRELDDLLAESDFVFVVVPLTEDTRELLHAGNVSRFKRNSILVNISRAGVIDEAALLTQLSSGHIFGAGLDVYYDETARFEHPNLVLTAHRANGEVRAIRATIALAVSNVAAVLAGEKPMTPLS